MGVVVDGDDIEIDDDFAINLRDGVDGVDGDEADRTGRAREGGGAMLCWACWRYSRRLRLSSSETCEDTESWKSLWLTMRLMRFESTRQRDSRIGS